MHLKVLAHPPPPNRLQNLFRSFSPVVLLICTITLLLLSFTCLKPVSAQIVVNGQVFTNGLAIVDAPQPNSDLHTGSPLSLAIDVSGNGKLPQAAMIPGSGLLTSFDLLEVYLISTSVNLTVSSGPGLLTQESGSTVKHVNWPIPTCLPPGSYNLTIYECSHIQGAPHFSITSIPVDMDNNGPSSLDCFETNPLQSQPQLSNPPPQNPWLSDSTSSPITGPLPTLSSGTFTPEPSGMLTIPSRSGGFASATTPSYTVPIVTLTVGPSGVVWPITVVPSGVPATIVIEKSAPPITVTPSPSVVTVTQTTGTTVTLAGGGATGAAGVSRVTVTVTPTQTLAPVTVVFVSVETMVSTTTAPGSTIIITSLSTSYSTTTAVMEEQDPEAAGFLPINAASPALSAALTFVWTLCFTTILVILQ